MHCWVNKGAKGIALIDEDSFSGLKYVFDISDVHKARRIGRFPNLWEMREEHMEAVISRLEKTYGDTDREAGFVGRIREIAGRIAEDCYKELASDMEYLKEGCFLEELDELNVEIRIRETLADSIAYTVLKRCGMEESELAEDGHVETLFTPLAPYETPEALDRICEEYNRVIGNMEVEPLIVIPVFIHDFLCIHPFNDGNGRMSRLLTTLLLYRSGFYVGKYISLEAKIAKNKDLYYDALGQAQLGWHEGTEDVLPFIKYLLGTILSAYKDFENRFALVETKLPALETVRRATMEKIGRFTKQDIRELCPSLSISSIEGALRKMVASGELKREGAGKNTCYYRLK